MVTVYIKSKIDSLIDTVEMSNKKAFFVESLTLASLLIIDNHLFVHLLMLLALYIPYPKKSPNYIERIDAFLDYFMEGYKAKDFY